MITEKYDFEDAQNGGKKDGISLDEKTTSFENKELGIQYTEIIEELTPEQQESTGIKRIRRKIITKGPSDLYEETYKNAEQYLFLTEGRFPSYQTWNHVLQGDAGSKSNNGIHEIKRFKSDGSWMQEMLPLKRISEKSMYGGFAHAPFFQKKDGKIEYGLPTSDYEKIRESLLVCVICASVSNEMWRDTKDLPFFIFGNKNKAFRNYVQQIQSNPELRKMLELSGWTLDSEIKLEKGRGKSYYRIIDGQEIQVPKFVTPHSEREKYSNEFLSRVVSYLESIAAKIPDSKSVALESAASFAEQAGDMLKAIELLEKNAVNGGNNPCKKAAVLALDIGDIEKARALYRIHLESDLRYYENEFKKYSFEQYYQKQIDSIKEELSTFDSTWKNKLEDLIKERDEYKKKSAEWVYNLPKFDTTYLKLLMNGIPIDHQVHIPIVRHPELKPLRWCHAEMMVTKEEGKTNVLFFETE